MNPLRSITLYHLMINDRKMIGIKFSPDRLIQGLIKSLPGPKWSKQYNMAYIPNTKGNLGIIFKTFKGMVWINYNRFLPTDLSRSTTIPLMSNGSERESKYPGIDLAPRNIF